MIRIYRVTKDPDYIDDEVMYFDNFADMETELVCICPVDELEMLTEMSTELIQKLAETFDSRVSVHRFSGDGITTIMEWIAE